MVRRIARALRPHSVWVTAAPEPALVRVANIQHLGTPIRAQLAAPLSAIELAGVLHPTPAVGGEPLSVAERLIPAFEGLDRGWYAGPVGWTRRRRRRRVLRGAALRAAARAARPPVRRRRDRARLRSGGRAGRDRGQAAARCCRCWPAEWRGASGPWRGVRVSRVESAASAAFGQPGGAARGSRPGSVRTSMIVVPPPAIDASTASAARSSVCGRSKPQPYSAAACAKSRPCGVATCSSNASRLAGHREEVEDPAAVVVEQRRSSAAGRAGGPPAGRRCRGRARRRRSAARPALAGGGRAERARDGAVDPVGAAVGEDARAVLVAGRNSSTSRIGIEEATNSVAPRSSHSPEAAGDERLGQPLAERGGDRLRRPRRRRRATRPASPDRRGSPRRRSGPRAARASGARTRRPTTLSGSCHAAVGVDRDLGGVEPGQPGAQRLGGRQVAGADHELGPVRVRRTPGRAAAGRSGRSPPGRAARPTAGRPAPGSRPRAAKPASFGTGGRVALTRRRRSRPARTGGGRSSGTLSTAASIATYGRPSARPVSSSGSGSSSTSGSRSGKLRCTGPGGP